MSQKSRTPLNPKQLCESRGAIRVTSQEDLANALKDLPELMLAVWGKVVSLGLGAQGLRACN